jgi:hypothetical protein
LEWFAGPEEEVTYGIDGTNSGSFVMGSHDVSLQLGEGTGVVVVNRGTVQTHWFWLGFVFSFITGLGAWGITFTKRMIVDGGINE